jgi:hypothetical protein
MPAEGMKLLGQDESGRWLVYEMAGASAYKLQLEGTVAEAESGNEPPIRAILPRIYDQAVWIVVLSLAALGAGFVLLYRNGRRLEGAVKKPR